MTADTSTVTARLFRTVGPAVEGIGKLNVADLNGRFVTIPELESAYIKKNYLCGYFASDVFGAPQAHISSN